MRWVCNSACEQWRHKTLSRCHAASSMFAARFYTLIDAGNSSEAAMLAHTAEPHSAGREPSTLE